MKYLNESERADMAARIAILRSDHVERVIFDRTLEAALPRALAGRYGDASEAIHEALGTVATFRDYVETGSNKDEPTKPLDKPAVAGFEDEVPF